MSATLSLGKLVFGGARAKKEEEEKKAEEPEKEEPEDRFKAFQGSGNKLR